MDGSIDPKPSPWLYLVPRRLTFKYYYSLAGLGENVCVLRDSVIFSKSSITHCSSFSALFRLGLAPLAHL
jgi:hypothetical protein